MIKTNDTAYRADNILSKEELEKRVMELKSEGKKIGLCSGSFDLLHPGHMTYFFSAKKKCDVLVVCVAYDRFSEQRKNKKGRPIFSEKVRAYSVSQLKPVDFVVLNSDDRIIMNLIKPDYYIKGPDYLEKITPDLQEQKEHLESLGGKLVFTEDEKLSTTDIIKYIKEEVE